MRWLSPGMMLVLSLAAGPAELEALGRFDLRSIPEASGIVKSRRFPGVFWVHNDSGNPSKLFAIRRDGTIVREFRLSVPNIDWEDIAADGDGHLYLGDIGNNGGALALRAVYQIDEPDPAVEPTGPLPVRAASFYRFSGSDRFDAESLIYDKRSGGAVVVAKRFDNREAELYAIPFHPAAPLLRPATPRLVGTLPRFVEPATGASLSADRDRDLLAVCSYTVTRVYRRAPQADGDARWELLAEVRYRGRGVEGVCWDGEDLIVVSEGQGVDRIASATWKRLARDKAPARPRAGP